ncbi:MAG TPA: hypothetical protein VMN81_06255 [Vicinamibacterales bacterium]|nr:hypothetical protein [Vicinamibacterales bacterium]
MRDTLRILGAAAVLALVPAAAFAQAPVRAQALTIAEPATLATIDLNDVKGQPSRLAWSSDGSELYFQTIEGPFGKADSKPRHYVFTVATGARTSVDAEPEWAAQYWTAKSWKASPDPSAPLEIELKSDQRIERTTSVPRGGDMARGGTSTSMGTSSEDGMKAAYNAQTVFTNSMVLKGEVVGRFENSVIVPGLTFGWGPPGSRAIAFAAQKSGRIVVMDAEGGKREIAASKDALLPAWSPDGRKLAWLQKDGRRTLLLKVSGID